MLRAIAVGSGWGSHAARVFGEDARTQLLGIVGTGSRRTLALAEELGVPAFSSLDEAIADARPQIAAVSVAARLHPFAVRALLEANCHVLCSHPVATDPRQIRILRELSRARNRTVATDYTLSLRPAYGAAAAALEKSGTLLRVAIRSPGRALIIAIELAVRLSGPVARVFAAGQYPQVLDGRRETSPDSFPPTVTLDHAGGVVSVVVPVPHATSEAAHRLEISAEHARIDLELPSGAASEIINRGGGRVDIRTLIAREIPQSPDQVFGRGMRDLVSRFIGSSISGTSPHCALDQEEHLITVWRAIRKSTRAGRPVVVARPRP